MTNRKRIRMKNGPSKTEPTAPKFWNMASTGDDSGEITLYGDVLSETPRNWDGEPAPGMYITPEGFIEDLKTVAGKKNITIKINSCGGDLYTGIAIHNAIKSLTGHKTVVVDGIAASAASVIMCAGDEVKVYGGSIVMIHGVSAWVVDAVNMQDLEKLQKNFDAAEKAIAAIYNAKTGIDTEELRKMMAEEKWMTGQEAIDLGFADSLIEGEGPSASLSADHKIMMVAGVRHDVSSFGKIPGSIPVNNRIQGAGSAGENINRSAQESDPENKEENMTIEELRAQYPELVAQIESDAVKAETKSAVERERERLQAIESIENTIPDKKLVNEAKYGETPMSAEQLALRAMLEQAKLGNSFLRGAEQDAKNSGAEEVKASAAANDPKVEKEEQDAKELENAVNSVLAMRGGKA